MDKEEVLVQTALARIQKAQAKGSTDVRLNQEQLAALERRRQRAEEEAAAAASRKKKKGSGSSSDRKKRKEQLIAVPLTQLPGEPISRKKKSGRSSQESLSRTNSATDLPEVDERRVYPPMGYFPPPQPSRTRPRSGTSASARPPSRAYDDRVPPGFEYEYIPRPSSSASRHASEGHRSRGHGPNRLDPFQFQTEGPGGLSALGAHTSSRRNASSPEKVYMSQYGVVVPAGSRYREHGSSRRYSPDDGTSEESGTSASESTSDDLSSGAQLRGQHPSSSRRDRAEVIVEVSPEREPPLSKKKSSSESKRKPTGGEKGGRRRRK